LLELAADGVQIYTCEAKEGGFQWSFKAPEGNLFDKQGRPMGTHFGGPSNDAPGRLASADISLPPATAKMATTPL